MIPSLKRRLGATRRVLKDFADFALQGMPRSAEPRLQPRKRMCTRPPSLVPRPFNAHIGYSTSRISA